MIELLLLLVSVVMVLACGAFVAAEFSFVTVNRSAVDREADSGDRKSQGVQSALKRLSSQLSAAQIGITITNLIIGFLAEPAISGLIDGPLQSAGISVGAATGVALAIAFLLANGVTMVFGELVPKNLAIARPLATARSVQGYQRAFARLVGPVVKVANAAANAILGLFDIESQEELASARSAEELSSLVRRSAEQGTLEMPTATLLEKSLEFGERRADDAMTPRVKVESLAPDDPVLAVIEAARETGKSRFPVLADSDEEVVGIVHLKHVMGVEHARRREVKIAEVMSEPVLVPSSMELDPLLTDLRKVGLQMAIVVDEFGSFDGIVTLEDLVEEIVGEVRDEHDQDDEPVRPITDQVWSLSGLLRPDEIGDQIDVFLPEDEDYETVAGLIAFRLGRVPGRGDSVGIKAVDDQRKALAVDLSVLRMDGLRIDRVRLEILKTEDDEEHDGGGSEA